ncbi:MAG: FAD binding domain-containing protein [Acidimicrobiia bacterium]
MITDYHRPDTLDEALHLLHRPGVSSMVIGGGTDLVTRQINTRFEVIDLQAACPNGVSESSDRVVIGAMTRLQDLIADEQVPQLLRDLARREGPNTLRNAGTIGGAVAAADPESELVAGLLVHDAVVSFAGLDGEASVHLDEFLADRSSMDGGIIVSVSVATGGVTAAARTGRTPADTSIVAAVGRSTADGTLVALTGVAVTPIVITRAEVSGLQPPPDFRGSLEYRRSLAGTLIDRVLADLGGAA